MSMVLWDKETAYQNALNRVHDLERDLVECGRRLRSEREDRRERIATAALQGLIMSRRYTGTYASVCVDAANEAVQQADALIAALDAK